VREREGLIARIRHLRRTAEAVPEPVQADRVAPEQDELGALETRVAHLEQLVQGLQDSVHRESSRQSKRLAELEARIQPGALGKALSDDARERGL
jgi:uncharacterized coiled-coil protein SlyX